MSGHSHASTVKHKKDVEDQKRGKIFSKLSKAIYVAIKTGGGNDPETNYKLRMAIDAAKQANMPKANIERALSKGEESGDLVEMTYEGFGPDGINILIDTATDNRNRTSQEVGGILERGGGRLAGPGAVSYNFDIVGNFLIEKKSNTDEQILSLIDLGAEDVEEVKEGVDVYVSLNDFGVYRDKLKENGQKILSSGMVKKPKVTEMIRDQKKAQKLLKLLNDLDDHDDVQGVYTNADIDDEVSGS
ncbi:YebC/PmpR family DNA-binding transcriptional regulator [Candidatus Woesebacteria bacterium]|nr:YebC/PmpR family DNA-binding transcriptional regulator [Candidatus Woesebacteria bacterium]